MFSILDSNTRNLHDDKKCPREAQGRPRNMSCLVPLLLSKFAYKGKSHDDRRHAMLRGLWLKHEAPFSLGFCRPAWMKVFSPLRLWLAGRRPTSRTVAPSRCRMLDRMD
jgi:hypothetical protein